MIKYKFKLYQNAFKTIYGLQFSEKARSKTFERKWPYPDHISRLITMEPTFFENILI